MEHVDCSRHRFFRILSVMTPNSRNLGFTPVRTVRLVSSIIAIFGMFCLFVERVLTAVYVVADDAVQTGFSFSNTFMVRFATENFSPAKKLFSILQQIGDYLPVADKCLLALFILSIVLIVVAAFGLVFPRQFGHVLVALKLLKCQNGKSPFKKRVPKGEAKSKDFKAYCDQSADFCRKTLDSLKRVQIKYWIFAACSLVFILVLVLGVRGCSNGGIFSGLQDASEDLKEQTLYYINAQKAFFAKNNNVGGPKSLHMPDSLKTDYFTYRVTGSRFAATLNKDVKNCPAGSRWTVNATTKGFFSIDLVLYRVAPKDTNCAVILPEFKNLGRK